MFHCLPMSLTWACQLLVRSGLLLCFPKKKNKIKRRLYPVVFHCITGVPQSSTSQVGLEEPKVKPTDENHRWQYDNLGKSLKGITLIRHQNRFCKTLLMQDSKGRMHLGSYGPLDKKWHRWVDKVQWVGRKWQQHPPLPILPRKTAKILQNKEVRSVTCQTQLPWGWAAASWVHRLSSSL